MHNKCLNLVSNKHSNFVGSEIKYILTKKTLVMRSSNGKGSLEIKEFRNFY